MKIFEIRELSTDDLKMRLKQEYESLENLRFQKTIGQLENFKSIPNTKKLIARIKTVLKEREDKSTPSGLSTTHTSRKLAEQQQADVGAINKKISQ